jgi:hypothetical protein
MGRPAVLSLLVLSTIATPALGQDSDPQPTTPWRSVPRPGARLVILAQSGESVEGTFVALLPSAIQVSSAGVRREIPLRDIATVRRNGDSLWNGIAWGAATAGLLVSGYNGDCDTCYSTAALAANRLAVVGIGAGIGALLDRLVHDTRVIYRTADAPGGSRRLQLIVRPLENALAVSLHW